MGLHQPQSLCTHARVPLESTDTNQPYPAKGKTKLPHPHVAPQYGANTQYAMKEDDSPLLNKEDTKYIQAVADSLLIYGQAINNTILGALSAIATKQANPTERTMKTIKQSLDYCTTQEEVVISYKASNMILAVHSDVGY